MSDCDVIIIGGGHNALVAASYLAKAGREVVVLEKNAQVGGAAITEEFFPGFKASTCAGGAGYLSDKVVADLKLGTHGLDIRPSDALVFVPQPDGSNLTVWRDSARTASEISSSRRCPCP
jgi:phytoene dehydrogenase-like protein